MNSLNIVELIENNPITRLTGTYQHKLLTKIKDNFTDNERQMFVASFYCFLNYDPKNDYVVDLDNVWKWLGFSSKQKAKDLLERVFIVNKDYKFLSPEDSKAKVLLNQEFRQKNHTRGGHNKETIILTIRTFKLFCLKAGTKKAEEIHEYYIKLEDLLQEVIHEESNELKLLLEQKNIELENIEKDKDKIREKTLLEQFPNNTQCVYYGTIENVSDKNEKLIKFGNSNHLKNRVIKHRDTYKNFCLVNAFKVENKLQIENAIKEHDFFIERMRNLTIKNNKYVELLNVDDISFIELDKTIKEIIKGIEYSPENYIKLLEDNKMLKKELEEKNKLTNNDLLLKVENDRLKIENLKLIKKYNKLYKKTNNICDDEEYEEKEIVKEEIENYGIIVNKLHKDFIKNKNGTYNINGVVFNKLYGTREEVWNGIAYKTTGYLIKKDLMINKLGKIVSRKKCIQETINKRFEKCGINKTNNIYVTI